MTTKIKAKSGRVGWALGLLMAVVALGALGFGVIGQSARAAHPTSTDNVAPVPFSGNIKNCSLLGSDFSVSTNTTPANGAVYAIGTGTVTVTTDGYHMSFVSTIPLTGVYMKASNGGNFYGYPAGSLDDGDLWGSTQDNSGETVTQGISHVVFCADSTDTNPPDGDLTVTKTAALAYERTCTWDVAKTSTTPSLTLDPGEAYEIPYTVTVTGNCVDDTTGTLSGSITVTNSGGVGVSGISLTDSMPGAVLVCEVDDTEVDETNFYLPVAGVATCTYTVEGIVLADVQDGGTNTATATGSDGDVTPVTDDDDATWTVPAAPAVINGDCTVVDDTNAAGPQDVEICSNGQAGAQTPAPIQYNVNGNASAEGCTTYDLDNTASLDNGEDATVTIPVTETCEAEFCKFYDANTNGINDDGFPLEGWRITVNGDAYFTGEDGCVKAQVAPGNITAVEGMPTSWFVTTDGGTSHALTTDDLQAGPEWSFGNVCVGAGGGHTRGYWSNKNGQTTMAFGPSGVEPELLMLRNLNLRNANGSPFDPTSYTQFRTWILGATATNMANMLSAQLAAMALNVEAGWANPGQLIYAPGALGANTLGFATLGDVMAEANASLGTYGLTDSAGAVRTYQEALKNALDAANNNLNFVQAQPCEYNFAQ